MPTSHNFLASAQELARRNNENAAIYRAYRVKLQQRRSLKVKSPLPKKTLDDLDRQAVERGARPTRTVGFFISKKP